MTDCLTGYDLIMNEWLNGYDWLWLIDWLVVTESILETVSTD